MAFICYHEWTKQNIKSCYFVICSAAHNRTNIFCYFVICSGGATKQQNNKSRPRAYLLACGAYWLASGAYWLACAAYWLACGQGWKIFWQFSPRRNCQSSWKIFSKSVANFLRIYDIYVGIAGKLWIQCRLAYCLILRMRLPFRKPMNSKYFVPGYHAFFPKCRFRIHEESVDLRNVSTRPGELKDLLPQSSESFLEKTFSRKSSGSPVGRTGRGGIREMAARPLNQSLRSVYAKYGYGIHGWCELFDILLRACVARARAVVRA